MTDPPRAGDAVGAEDAAQPDEVVQPCPFCGAVRDPAMRVSGVCPACGQWDPDDDINRPRLLAWIERTRRAGGRGASDDSMDPQQVEKDDARR